jgi:hypothetical protein
MIFVANQASFLLKTPREISFHGCNRESRSTVRLRVRFLDPLFVFVLKHLSSCSSSCSSGWEAIGVRGLPARPDPVCREGWALRRAPLPLQNSQATLHLGRARTSSVPPGPRLGAASSLTFMVTLGPRSPRPQRLHPHLEGNKRPRVSTVGHGGGTRREGVVRGGSPSHPRAPTTHTAPLSRPDGLPSLRR